ncbi:MAG: phosphodiester glycosidase family protein [Chthoniobacterales bacterium]|nr:phosphodiester glycosidase family protein [Chthoniobacterales bacterium]
MATRRNFIWLLFILACVCSARAEWTVLSSEVQAKGPAGVVHAITKARDGASGERATLHFALFPMKTATLRVIDDPSRSRLDLAATMQREGCIAGVNGGYFDPDHAPVGLLISDGRLIAPQKKARLLSGVLSVANGRVVIQRAAEFSMKTKPTAARQAGPFLVEAAKPVAGLNNVRAARRTFVATAPGDRAAIGYSSHVTLAQLGALLATPGIAPDLKIQRALNLDGGSSSGFWFDGEGEPFSIAEQKSVRDYIGVVAK